MLLTVLAAAALVSPAPPEPAPAVDDFSRRLIDAALERTTRRVTYDGRYRRIGYPGGDVPDHVGVCTDLIIRSYRAVGIDLQVTVHEDMTVGFPAYPTVWGLTRPDPSIDHRRVLNLRVFFRRRGSALPVTADPDDYRPGDLVTWRLPSRLPHIGLVIDRRSPDGARPLIVHNIGRGPEVEDVLFAFPITGHYRYAGDRAAGVREDKTGGSAGSRPGNETVPSGEGRADLSPSPPR